MSGTKFPIDIENSVLGELKSGIKGLKMLY